MDSDLEIKVKTETTPNRKCKRRNSLDEARLVSQ